jgi:hypothetical protein
MFRSKEINGSPAIEAPPPSLAAIAVGVRKTSEHAALAAQISKLETERQAVIDETRTAIAANASGQNDPQIRKLQKRREKTEEALIPLRMQIRPMRDAHSERVREALTPAMREKARAFIHALAEQPAAAAFLNDCETEIERAGGSPSFERFETRFGYHEMRARQIAGLTEGEPS